MSGAETLEHLKGDFPRLQTAVRNGAIKGRARGREKDREFWVNQGLTWDHDFVHQVDNPWRAKFILSPPESIDPKEFGEQSELLREDFLRCFGKELSRKAVGPQPRYSLKDVSSFVENYMRKEKEAGRKPRCMGLEKEAQEQGLKCRAALRQEFQKRLSNSGDTPQRGRPPKSGK
jgi:hypothetical protein